MQIHLKNDEEKKAGIIKCNYKTKELFIPRSIIHESKEYDVTRIQKYAFRRSSSFIWSNIKSIQFPSDSKIQIIDEEAFLDSSLECLTIPS